LSHLRARALRLPVIGILLERIGASGGSRAPKRRPTAEELMQMDDATFASFVRLTGLERRVATAVSDRDDATS